MKVLHVVESLDRGAVENWLVRMLEFAKRQGVRLDWTFYCTLAQPGLLEERARHCGARIVHSPVPLAQPGAFISALRRELKRGDYDVLHCHHDLVSGIYLAASVGLPIRRRLVHAHNSDESVLTPSPLKQRLYRPLLRGLCLAIADGFVGNSNHTLDTLLAGRLRRLGSDTVHYYGVDPSPFGVEAPDRAAFRRGLDLPEDAIILLFGGRMTPEKNPVFTVDILAALRSIEPRTFAVFAGEGSEELAVVERAKLLGVGDSVRMLGWRSDLPNIMRNADWFILPRPEHPKEGFGLAIVEAQLAGLRLLVSQGVPDDPFLATASFRRLSLKAPAAEWAAAAVDLMADTAPSPTAAFQALRESPMDMNRALDDLIALQG